MAAPRESDFCSDVDTAVPIKNFRTVTPWLFRGGQPDAEGIAALSKLGVHTVINVRRGRRSVEAERRLVEAAGLTFINIALNYWFPPDQQTIAQFFCILDDESKRPVYVHCLHGKDRTGLLMAMFRVARQGWPVEKAYREMKYCGYHRFGVRNFKWLLFSFARKLERQSG